MAFNVLAALCTCTCQEVRGESSLKSSLVPPFHPLKISVPLHILFFSPTFGCSRVPRCPCCPPR